MTTTRRARIARWGGATLLALAPLPWLGVGVASAASSSGTRGEDIAVASASQSESPSESPSETPSESPSESPSVSPSESSTSPSVSPSESSTSAIPSTSGSSSQPGTHSPKPSVKPTRSERPGPLPHTGSGLPVGQALAASALLIGLGALLLAGPGRLAVDRYHRKH